MFRARWKRTMLLCVTLFLVLLVTVKSRPPNHVQNLSNDRDHRKAENVLNKNDGDQQKARNVSDQAQERINGSGRTVAEDTRSLILRIHARMTRSRDAVWASFSLTLIFVLLVFAVCYSRMWRDYNGASSVIYSSLPVFYEKVKLKDLLKRNKRLFLIFQKKTKPTNFDQAEMM